MFRFIQYEYECPKCGHKEPESLFLGQRLLVIDGKVFCQKCFMKIIEQIIPQMVSKEVVTEHPDRIHH